MYCVWASGICTAILIHGNHRRMSGVLFGHSVICPWDWFSYLAWSWIGGQQNLLTSCFLPTTANSTGIVDVWLGLYLALQRFWGFELSSSCLYNKFTHCWAFSQAAWKILISVSEKVFIVKDLPWPGLSRSLAMPITRVWVASCPQCSARTVSPYASNSCNPRTPSLNNSHTARPTSML